jgi:hypothetical protein
MSPLQHYISGIALQDIRAGDAVDVMLTPEGYVRVLPMNSLDYGAVSVRQPVGTGPGPRLSPPEAHTDTSPAPGTPPQAAEG